MSETSQSIFRATLLAAITAMFVAVWSADSSQSHGLTLARRNQLIVPAHAMGSAKDAAALAALRPPTHRAIARANRSGAGAVHRPSIVDATSVLDELSPGAYRVVYGDGRVEWLRVIDRDGNGIATGAGVVKTSLGGQAVHLIRIADEESTADVLH
jgi:hypothetical protein